MDNSRRLESTPMLPKERRWVFGLSMLVGLRMLGLFMAMPVMSVYGQGLVSSTPLLLGISVGAYGLTQALLQIPLGWLSDRVGRKPVILGGLVLFVLGSLIAATSTSIYQLIVGRLIQGGGAIAATVMALLSDLTRDSQRTKAMAVLGLTIGVSFALALVFGPMIAGGFGLEGLFYLTAIFGGFALIICMVMIPKLPTPNIENPGSLIADLRQVLGHRRMLKMDMGVFILHGVMTAFFVVVPQMLFERVGLLVVDHWKVYLPVLFVSFMLMGPIIMTAQRRGWADGTIACMIGCLILSQLLMAYIEFSLFGWVVAVLVYFIGFNTLEALMPSLMSKLAPEGKRGISMGVYSSCQFLGAFGGGWFSGCILGYFDADGLYLALALVLSFWLLSVIVDILRGGLPAALSEGVRPGDRVDGKL